MRLKLNSTNVFVTQGYRIKNIDIYIYREKPKSGVLLP